jgi:hypothetical protein
MKTRTLFGSMLAVPFGIWLIFGFIVIDWDVTSWDKFGRLVYVVFVVFGVLGVLTLNEIKKPIWPERRDESTDHQL